MVVYRMPPRSQFARARSQLRERLSLGDGVVPQAFAHQVNDLQFGERDPRRLELSTPSAPHLRHPRVVE